MVATRRAARVRPGGSTKRRRTPRHNWAVRQCVASYSRRGCVQMRELAHEGRVAVIADLLERGRLHLRHDADLVPQRDESVSVSTMRKCAECSLLHMDVQPVRRDGRRVEVAIGEAGVSCVRVTSSSRDNAELLGRRLCIVAVELVLVPHCRQLRLDSDPPSIMRSTSGHFALISMNCFSSGV